MYEIVGHEGDQMKAETMEDISFARFKENNTKNIK